MFVHLFILFILPYPINFFFPFFIFPSTRAHVGRRVLGEQYEHTAPIVLIPNKKISVHTVHCVPLNRVNSMNNEENKRPCGRKQLQDLTKRYEKGLLERLKVTIEPFFGGFHVNLERPCALRELGINFRIFR